MSDDPAGDPNRDFPDAAAVRAWVLAAKNSPSAAERNAATVQLVPVISKIASQVLWAFGNPTGVDFADFAREAPSLVWPRLPRYDESKGPFGAWCREVLKNVARTLLRKQEVWPPAFGEGGEDAGSAWHERKESLESRRGKTGAAARELRDDLFYAIRGVLDDRNWDPHDDVDYYAVFLMDLRLRLAYLVALGQHIDEHPAQAVAELLPFRADEIVRELRAGWVNLGQTWAAVAPLIDAPPFYVEAKALCSSVTSLKPDCGKLSTAGWYQWKTRAKREAQERMGEQVWSEHFAVFFGRAEAQEQGRRRRR